jgi:hypothetical protein
MLSVMVAETIDGLEEILFGAGVGIASAPFLSEHYD